MNTSKRLYKLDYLRAIACLAVMLYHFTYRYDQLFGAYNVLYVHSVTLFRYGYLGVHIFFILSAYLCCRLERKVSLRYELINRIIRLYPMYWLSILLSIAVGIMFGYVQLLDTLSILMNFTMLQSLVGCPSVDGVYWTLIYELLSFIYIILIRKLLSDKYSAPAIQSVFLGMVYLQPVCKMLTGIPGMGTLSLLMLNGYAGIFAIGISLAYLSKSKGKMRVFYAICLLAEVGADLWFFKTYATLIAVVAIVVIVFAPSKGESKPYCRVFIVISEASYCIYLFHNNLGQSLIAWMNMKMAFPFEISVCLALVTVLLMSCIVHITLEDKIAQRLKKKLLK